MRQNQIGKEYDGLQCHDCDTCPCSRRNANYTPGEDGVNPEQDLNQADPLGLSDTERAIIDEAVNAKRKTMEN